jgi:predicted transcriptional regulator|tara:strand:- start:797 stop:1093 length:297 start_codon:yes stop_codon:yes gene_type:complete
MIPNYKKAEIIVGAYTKAALNKQKLEKLNKTEKKIREILEEECPTTGEVLIVVHQVYDQFWARMEEMQVIIDQEKKMGGDIPDLISRLNRVIRFRKKK